VDVEIGLKIGWGEGVGEGPVLSTESRVCRKLAGNWGEDEDAAM
jgi:hypothetical protein